MQKNVYLVSDTTIYPKFLIVIEKNMIANIFIGLTVIATLVGIVFIYDIYRQADDSD